MKRRSLYFTAPNQTEIRAEELSDLKPGDVLVETLISAISPGTEMLVYRGQFSMELAVDETISSLAGEFRYPMKYGYSSVGRVADVGKNVDRLWLHRRVFAFQPHETTFTAPVEALLPLPEEISPEDAVFLPNMETAVNFLLDGQPLIGEHVIVFGQGIVGLLTTTLLAGMPVASLITVDRFTQRRETSLAAGAHSSLDPTDGHFIEHLHQLQDKGADLTFELSGNPQALDQAIAATGFNGRVVIGSWYGQKRADLDLGGAFHRSRIRLISSQVSTMTPELSGRWSKERRMAVAWRMVAAVQPSRFITHRFDFDAAGEAYKLIDQHPEQTIQVVLTYRAGT
jgi:2-desacetyl-2-hydroxyethyl bacteriochlorophyllide A dehydrogenase